jgi:hypothetical protein
MAFDYSRLTEITTIPETFGAVYNNPADVKTYIRLIIIHNTNTTVETINLWNVPDDAAAVGVAADTNKMFKTEIAAGGTAILEYGTPGIILEDTNDTIQASTTTAGKVTIQIMGGKE